MNTIALSLRRLFIPHEGNNHQAKLRQHSGLLGLIALVVLIQLWIQMISLLGPKILGYASSITVDQILTLTNNQRANYGAHALKLNAQLSQAARNKARDMFDRNYWAHVTPTGEQPWSFIAASGYSYKYAGENLARDFYDSPSVVNAWMASPGHKANIINNNYDDIGIAVENGLLNGVETTLVVQMFGTPRASSQKSLAQVPSENKNDVPLAPTATPTPTLILSPTSTPILVALEGTDVARKLVPTVEPTLTPVPIVASIHKSKPNGANNKSLLNPFAVNKAVGLAIVFLLIVVLMLDEWVMKRKHLTRIAGRTWAHLVFLVTTLGIIVLSTQGIIL